MRCVIRQITEKRLLLISLDEINGGVRKQIGHITPRLHGSPVDDHLIRVGIAFNVSMIMSKEMVEAPSMRLILRVTPQMPFAEQTRFVACFLQNLRNRRFMLPECVSPKPRIVQTGSQIMPARHQPGPGRRTNHVGIEPRKGDSFGCQLFNCRRFDLGVTGYLRIPIPLIVGHDQNNIRLSSFFFRLKRLAVQTKQTRNK